MDLRLKELIDFTKEKFGLDQYYLKESSLSRSVDFFLKTSYTLTMEWLPKYEVDPVEEGTNPKGTAVIEMDVHTRKVKSAIFVMDTTYAKNGVTIRNVDRNTIIDWVEQETGLIYGEQFKVHKEKGGELQFVASFNGVRLSPSGSIDVHFNEEGNLISFSIYGQFPSKTSIHEENFSLTMDAMEPLAQEQLKLIEYPDFEKQTRIPLYVLEETYVTNDGSSTLPFNMMDVSNGVSMEKVIVWDEPINQPFVRKEINMMEEVTTEQAFSCEPSPDALPITTEERDQCIAGITNFLRQEYQKDTGKWSLHMLYRENGFIHGILKYNHRNNLIFNRKMTVILDAETFQVLNYIDNKSMMEMFAQFDSSANITIAHEEAYHKLKHQFELTPYYVFSHERNKYILCGKLDCHHGVNAVTGEVVSLDDL